MNCSLKSKCPLCPLLLSSDKKWDKHMKTVHSVEKPYKCDQCESTFRARSILNVHYKHIHTLKEGIKCPRPNCKKTFKFANSIWRHIRNHHDKKKPKILVSCPKCQKVMCKDTLTKHLQLHEKPEKNKCNICSKVYWNKQSLRQHTQDYHSSSLRQPHKCNKCDKCFTTKGGMEMHQKFNCPKGPTGKRIPCHLCNKPMIPYNYNRHVKSCSGRVEFQCYFCPKEFTHAELMQMHMLAIHIKERPFSCKFCPFKSSRSPDIRKHVKKKHEVVTPVTSVPCYFCGKGYIGSRGAANHIKAVHLNERPYKCGKCPKRFTSLASLNYHLATGGITKEAKEQHGILPEDAEVECPKCLKVVKRGSLYSHLRRIHENGNLKRYKCGICSKVYRWKASLSEHIKTHDPTRKNIICEECGATFSSRTHLITHEKTHGVRIKTPCQKCGTTVYPHHYNKHMRYVHGPPRYTCYFCGNAYKSFHSLSYHLLGNHVKEIPFKCHHQPCSYRTHSADLLGLHLKLNYHSM